jgi:hypothetical protein
MERYFDRDLEDIFAIQDEIAQAIVSELRLTLSGKMAEVPLAREETADPEAHILLLRGIAAGRLGTPEGDFEAIRLLREAFRLDSTYVRARAELSSYLWLAAYLGSLPGDEPIAEARRAVEQRDEFAADFGVDPALDPLRDDPRMERLLRMAGLHH